MGKVLEVCSSILGAWLSTRTKDEAEKGRMRDREGHSCQENIASLGYTREQSWRVKFLIWRNEARDVVEWDRTVKLLMYPLNTTSWVWELRGLVGSGLDFAPVQVSLALYSLPFFLLPSH